MIYNLEEMDESTLLGVSLTNVSPSTFFHESKWFKPVVDEIVKIVPKARKSESQKKAILWFVTQSARVVKTKSSGFYVSLDPKSYTDTKQGLGYRPVRKLIDDLEMLGYIDLYIGFVQEWDNGNAIRKYQSFIQPTEKCIQLWSKVSPSKIPKHKPTTLVVIRDRETEEEKPTKGVLGIKELKEQVTMLNEALATTCIEYKGSRVAPIEYHRVFTNSLQEHGRFYVNGGGVQLLPATYRRSFLTFDGEPVVELDYASMHPNILYERVEMQGGYGTVEKGQCSIKEILGEDFKPYGANVSKLVKVYEEVVKAHQEKYDLSNYDPVRNLLKKALIISINAVDRHQANACLKSKIYNDQFKQEEYREFVGIDPKVQAFLVCDAIKEHNYLIEDYFYADMAHTLMNVDSNIATRVVNAMLDIGQPILLYHDSFVVKGSAYRELYHAMHVAWKEVIGDNKFCKIDIKTMAGH